MELYVRAYSLWLKFTDPKDGLDDITALATFESTNAAIRTLNWFDKFTTIEEAIFNLIALCEKRRFTYDRTIDRQVTPNFPELGKAIYKHVGYYVPK